MGIHVKVASFVVDFYPAMYLFEFQDGHYLCRYYAIRINDVHILCSCPTLIFWFWFLVVCRIDRFAPTPWNPSFPQHLSIKVSYYFASKGILYPLVFVGTLTLQRHGHPMFLRLILNRFTSTRRSVKARVSQKLSVWNKRRMPRPGLCGQSRCSNYFLLRT